MAEVFGGALLNVLFDRLGSPEVVDFFKGKKSTVKLEELNSELRSAGLLLNDAEEKLIKDQKVRDWLGDLKEAVYDADDLVYKIQTLALEKQQKSSFTTKVKNKLSTPFKKEIRKGKIEEIIKKLKRLKNDNPGLRRVEKQELPERLPTPFVKESEVYGRDAYKEDIIKLLLSDDASAGDNSSVISIVGMGGIGKTTLAHLVYRDERVNNRFDTKAWVTVGDDKVDCMKVMKIILQQVTDSKECKIEEQYVLQNELEKALTGKKFLFVIDDVWYKDLRKWDVLKNSVASGLRGSKIIVTTRNQDVELSMKARSIYHLLGVSNEDGWLLFAKHALIDVNSDEYSNLQKIGRDIVEKCRGLPLAIKSLSGLLALERNEKKWVDVLTSDTWELDESKSTGILPALWLSYYYLPSPLKSCFAYCAMFPKDYKFKKEKLILLWMAEGLLHSKDKKRMEDIGEKYFEDLVSMSFFQPSSGRDSDLLVMHALVHDLAIFVSGEFCLQMDDAKFSNCAHKVRHLSYVGDDIEKFEASDKAKCLRTFIMLDRGNWSFQMNFQMNHLLEPLLHTRSCLRVLSLYRCNIAELPDSIGDLKYLKYLELSGAGLHEIPETICSLYNLQTLMLDECNNLTRLPANIGNLINLRHLSLPYTLGEMPQQIGKLTSLYTLNRFNVGPENGSASIKQLKELQNLHGTLEISGMENVACVKDDLGTVLKDKKFLSELTLKWGYFHNADGSQKEKEVLGALKLHANLKELSIWWYPGTDFPNLVGDHLFSNIVKLSLMFCQNCSVLPPLGQLSSLKHLMIQGSWGVKEINSEFYNCSAGSSASGTKPFRSLETLHFESSELLEKWSFMEGEVEGGVFPRLKELRLIDCPKLKSLPGFFPSLRILDTDDCGQIPPIVPRGQQMYVAFPCLEILKMNLCYRDGLHVLGGLPTSLKEISLESCGSLTALDNCFECLASLEKLHISHCDWMRCLPKELPASLSDLSIIDCCLVTPRRSKRVTGKDWPIIAHIPNVTIEPNLDDEEEDDPNNP